MFLHLLAVCAALWLPVVAGVIVIAGIIASAYTNVRLFMRPSSPGELRLGADGAIVGQFADGGEASFTLGTHRILAGGLVVMTLRPVHGGRSTRLTLLPGDQVETSLRNLRVWLRWRRGGVV